MFTSNVKVGYRCLRGRGKLSRLVYLATPPPAQDMSQALSSVSSYCTIVLEYLVIRVVNIISVKIKMRCLHLMFSSDILIRGVGGQTVQAGLSCPPAQDLSQALSSVNSYCTITLEYLVVRVVNIISVKLGCKHQTFSSLVLVRAVGCKLSRLVY